MPRIGLIGLALLILGVTPSSGSESYGTIVEAIEFDPPLPARAEGAVRAVVQGQIGSTLERAGVRSTIKALFRSGRFTDIQAEAEPTAGGARLIFRTKPAWFTGNVTVTGVPRPPSEGQLLNATQLRLGEPFTAESVPLALRSLRTVLAEHGFMEPLLEPVLDRHSATQQVDVEIRVTTGPRARFGALLVVDEDPQLSAEEVRRIADWPRKAPFERSRIHRGVERLREYFQKREHWGATIRVEPATYEANANQVTSVVRIERGPRIRARIEGTPGQRNRLRKLLPILLRGSADQDLLMAGNRTLQDFYRSRGFYAATAAYEVERRSNAEVSVVYQVDRGGRGRLEAITVRGNRAIDDDAVLERIQLSVSGPAATPRDFSGAALQRDIAAIRSLYMEQGYREAEVTGRFERITTQGSGAMAAVFDIEEGKQTLVGSLVASGLEGLPAGTREFDFANSIGMPYSERSVAQDRRQVLDAFYDAGYRDVRFDWEALPLRDANEMTVSYTVTPGDRTLIGSTILSGASRTRDDVLGRGIELDRGTALSSSRIFATQRNLYSLGVFSKVDIAVQNPDGAEQRKNVLVQLREARRWALRVGGGAELARFGTNTAELTNPAGEANFSPRIAVEVARRNVGGRAHTIGFSTRLSFLQQRGLFTYEAPRWFDSDKWRLTVTGLYDTFRNINTFTGKRLEGALQLTQQVSSSMTVLYRYAYRRTSIDENTLNIQPLLVPLVSQPVRVGLFAGTLISDVRDNPTDTTSGTFTTVNLAMASKYWGAQPNFAKMLVQNSTYHRIRSRLVFARNIQLGVNVPWGGRQFTDPSQLGVALRPDSRIPLPERYFGGGANSHRGFAYNQSGPRDSATGFPLGGGSQFLNSLELRFPLRGPDFSGVLFHDAGNVYSRPSRISFRSSQPVSKDPDGQQVFDFDYMVHAVGMGIRYRTPIGPIRLDVAYSPNTPRFVGFDGTRAELLTGAGTVREQRLSAVQFHFSLGHTF